MIMVLISIMPSTRRQHTTKKTLRVFFFLKEDLHAFVGGIRARRCGVCSGT
jgi:hypothetical protein